MVDISVKNTVVKTPIAYRQTLEYVYPKENIQNSIKAWKENIADHTERLEKMEETRAVAIDTLKKNVTEEYKKNKEHIDTLYAKTPEERAAQFEAEFQQMRAEFYSKTEEQFLSEVIDNGTKEINERLRNIELQSKQQIKEKQEALDLWQNAKSE